MNNCTKAFAVNVFGEVENVLADFIAEKTENDEIAA